MVKPCLVNLPLGILKSSNQRMLKVEKDFKNFFHKFCLSLFSLFVWWSQTITSLFGSGRTERIDGDLPEKSSNRVDFLIGNWSVGLGHAAQC